MKRLPRRALPVAVLAWLGVSADLQRRGIGRRLLTQALRDCFIASETFAFVAVVLVAVDERARDFYCSYDFAELPGYPYRLFLSAKRLEALMQAR